jgi:hypothetical protein
VHDDHRCIYSKHIAGWTIYEYIDKAGSIVLTDSPPPEVKAKPARKYCDMTEAEKQALEKKKSSAMQNYQEA